MAACVVCLIPSAPPQGSQGDPRERGGVEAATGWVHRQTTRRTLVEHLQGRSQSWIIGNVDGKNRSLKLMTLTADLTLCPNPEATSYPSLISHMVVKSWHTSWAPLIPKGSTNWCRPLAKHAAPTMINYDKTHIEAVWTLVRWRLCLHSCLIQFQSTQGWIRCQLRGQAPTITITITIPSSRMYWWLRCCIDKPVQSWKKVMIIKINYHLNAMPNKLLIHWNAFWSFFNDCLPFSSCSTSVTPPLGLFPFSCSCGSAEVDRSPWRCVLTKMIRLGDDTYHHREDRRQLHSWCTWMS